MSCFIVTLSTVPQNIQETRMSECLSDLAVPFEMNEKQLGTTGNNTPGH